MATAAVLKRNSGPATSADCTAEQLRIVIVDDEPPAARCIKQLLAPCENYVVVGECNDGACAIRTIAEEEPDIVLLDIHLPDMTGFDVIAEIGVSQMPLVIFATAFDHYAVRAFEAHAVDYLLKPVSGPRLFAALDRAAQRLRESRRDDFEAHLRQVLDQMSSSGGGRDSSARIKVRGRDGVYFVPTEAIDRVEVSRNHLTIHAGRERHIMRDTMDNMERRLPHTRFLRVHRAAIVNLDRVRAIQPWFHGDYVVIMQDGTKVTTGRRYREKVRALLSA
jgi:two-component system LytT family response regulator